MVLKRPDSANHYLQKRKDKKKQQKIKHPQKLMREFHLFHLANNSKHLKASLNIGVRSGIFKCMSKFPCFNGDIP